MRFGSRKHFALALPCRLFGFLLVCTRLFARARDDFFRFLCGLSLLSCNCALARFDRQRDRDRGLLVGVTDQLARGFRVGGFHGLQSTLLTALDLLPALRRPLADTLLYGRRQSA